MKAILLSCLTIFWMSFDVLLRAIGGGIVCHWIIVSFGTPASKGVDLLSIFAGFAFGIGGMILNAQPAFRPPATSDHTKLKKYSE